MKYYYIQYTITCPVTNTVCKTDCVSKKHPFEWLKFFDCFGGSWDLISWKKINESEYEIGKESIGIG